MSFDNFLEKIFPHKETFNDYVDKEYAEIAKLQETEKKQLIELRYNYDQTTKEIITNILSSNRDNTSLLKEILIELIKINRRAERP